MLLYVLEAELAVTEKIISLILDFFFLNEAKLMSSILNLFFNFLYSVKKNTFCACVDLC